MQALSLPEMQLLLAERFSDYQVAAHNEWEKQAKLRAENINPEELPPPILEAYRHMSRWGLVDVYATAWVFDAQHQDVSLVPLHDNFQGEMYGHAILTPKETLARHETIKEKIDAFLNDGPPIDYSQYRTYGLEFWAGEQAVLPQGAVLREQVARSGPNYLFSTFYVPQTEEELTERTYPKPELNEATERLRWTKIEHSTRRLLGDN